MASQGADRKDIWTATGWFQGTDKKWRFETDVYRKAADIVRADTPRPPAPKTEVLQADMDAARDGLSHEQRRAIPPWESYDVPEDQQIVRMADGSSQSPPGGAAGKPLVSSKMLDLLEPDVRERIARVPKTIRFDYAQPSGNAKSIDVHIMDGSMRVGSAYIRMQRSFYGGPLASIQMGNLELTEKYRRLGIMTALQYHMEEKFGVVVLPDLTLSEGEFARWAALNPYVAKLYEKKAGSSGAPVFTTHTEVTASYWDKNRIDRLNRSVIDDGPMFSLGDPDRGPPPDLTPLARRIVEASQPLLDREISAGPLAFRLNQTEGGITGNLDAPPAGLTISRDGDGLVASVEFAGQTTASTATPWARSSA